MPQAHARRPLTRALARRWLSLRAEEKNIMQFQPVHTQWLLTLMAARGIAFMFAVGLAGS